MDLGDFELSDFLPYRLAVLSERVSRRLAVIYEGTHGLTLAEWRVLVHLARCREVSVREIHGCVNLEKPRVSRAVTSLEAAGLVSKKPGSTDSRLVAISLTEAGKKVLAEIVPEAMEYEAALRAAFTPEELTHFLGLAEKLHRVLDDDPEARPRSRMDLPSC